MLAIQQANVQQNSVAREQAKGHKVEIDRYVRNIMLIGPSQNGKSSLANFLVSGKALSDNPKDVLFPIGDGTTSVTKEFSVKAAEWTYKYLPPEHANTKGILGSVNAMAQFQICMQCTFQVIDTPGIGGSDEDAEQDAMTEVYDILHRMKKGGEKFSLALLVLKYPPFLDADLERHVKFYKKMIPDFMHSNLMLVVTDVHMSETWVRSKTRGGAHPPNEVIKSIRKKLQQWLDLKDLPPTFSIDSLFEKDTAESDNAVFVRTKIFEFCMKAPDVELRRVSLPKTTALLNADELKISLRRGQKIVISKRIQDAEVELDSESKTFDKLRQKLQKAKSSLHESNVELKKKDCDVLCKIYSQRFTQEWSICGWAKVNFDIRTSHPINEKRLEGKGSVAYFTDKKKNIKGILYSPFWRSLDRNLVLLTVSKHYYKEEIISLKEKVSNTGRKCEDLEREVNDRRSKINKQKTELKKLQQTLSDIDNEIQFLSNKYLHLDDLQHYISGQQLHKGLDLAVEAIESDEEFFSCETHFNQQDQCIGFEVLP